MRSKAALLPAILSLTAPALACDLALLLAVDVSGSVDRQEYRIQMDGLANALRDPLVSEALVRARAEVALLEWTGSRRQQLSIPWRPLHDFDAIMALAQTIETTERPWRHFSTAIGEALMQSMTAFSHVPHCKNKVIDLSGDGQSNEGIAPDLVRETLNSLGIIVNAIAIEGAVDDLTAYFWENVITGEGAFVETAYDFADYPEKIRKKLRRETTIQLAKTLSPKEYSIQAFKIEFSAGN